MFIKERLESEELEDARANLGPGVENDLSGAKVSPSSCREKIDVEWKIPVAEMADRLCEFADEELIADSLCNWRILNRIRRSKLCAKPPKIVKADCECKRAGYCVLHGTGRRIGQFIGKFRSMCLCVFPQ